MPDEADAKKIFTASRRTTGMMMTIQQLKRFKLKRFTAVCDNARSRVQVLLNCAVSQRIVSSVLAFVS